MNMRDGLEQLAEDGDFSGVVRVARSGVVTAEFARGFADRGREIPSSLATCFGAASATKGFTALTVMSLVESGELALDTTLRSLMGDVLDNVDPAVTVEHLLSHRSGVGDYIDESAGGDIDDYVLGEMSTNALQRPADYVGLLRPHPQVSEPGERFAYNNSGYVMLSMMIEQVTGSFHDAVRDRVLEPAGIADGGFFRMDDLPASVAVGYLKDGRSNSSNLPVIGAGDGGIFLSLDDVSAFWRALWAGEIISAPNVHALATPRSDAGSGNAYGLGFWLGEEGDLVWLEGMDAGVSFQSGYRRSTDEMFTVMSNTSTDAWPVVDLLLAD